MHTPLTVHVICVYLPPISLSPLFPTVESSFTTDSSIKLDDANGMGRGRQATKASSTRNRGTGRGRRNNPSPPPEDGLEVSSYHGDILTVKPLANCPFCACWLGEDQGICVWPNSEVAKTAFVAPKTCLSIMRIRIGHFISGNKQKIKKINNNNTNPTITLCATGQVQLTKEHVDIMIFIERYPLKRCQDCVKLVASKVSCFLNINYLSEVQLCMSSNSWTWEWPHTKDGADHVPLIILSSVYLGDFPIDLCTKFTLLFSLFIISPSFPKL